MRHINNINVGNIKYILPMSSETGIKIPKILHQIWIGPKPAPTNLMQSWKDKHPDFEYIYWNESEFQSRGMTFECYDQIAAIAEINGKADIIRWEILHRYGGVFVDADSICIEPFDDYFMEKEAFATYENESVRKGLVATGTMGFVPGHPLCCDIIDMLKSGKLDRKIAEYRAWYSVGPALLTECLDTGKYPNFAVFPSYCFLPIHFTGPKYEGHRKVYGYQEWGTAKQSYDTMNQVVLPNELKEPSLWVSVLVSSYNTPLHFLRECLDSIAGQTGHFGIELVWINDGSTRSYTEVLETALLEFRRKTRFTKIVYERTGENRGINIALNRGVTLCTNDLIFRMDSDDIMAPNRLHVQIDYMSKTPDCVVCGTGIQTFRNPEEGNFKRKVRGGTKIHPAKYTWDQFILEKPTWILNHPTLCFRRTPLLAVGNYNTDRSYVSYMEDYELELRLMKIYGSIHSLPDILLYYRIHEGQTTAVNKMDGPEYHGIRNRIIDIISSIPHPIVLPEPHKNNIEFILDK